MNTPVVVKRHWSLVKGVIWAVLLIIGIALLKHQAEESDLGKRFLLLSFEYLQRLSSNFTAEDRLGVLVVDISKIPGGREAETTTPRRPLEALIDAIAFYRPAVITLDVDLSPGENGWKRPDEDPEFLAFCLEKNASVPIIVGVYKSRNQDTKVWLGVEQFAGLAADAQAPLEGTTKVTSRVPAYHQASDVKAPLRRMGFAMAKSYIDRKPAAKWPPAPALLAWALEPTAAEISQQVDEGNVAPDPKGFLINYSKLDQLRHETLATITPTSVAEFSEYFRGKIVILGDVRNHATTDSFIPPGRGTTPGVFLHASVAYTHAFEPLFEFKSWVRYALDGLFSLPMVVILFWAHIRRKTRLTGADEKRVQLLQGLACVAGAVAILVLGALVMGMFRIMWLDFILVAIALLLHPLVERGFKLVEAHVFHQEEAAE